MQSPLCEGITEMVNFMLKLALGDLQSRSSWIRNNYHYPAGSTAVLNIQFKKILDPDLHDGSPPKMNGRLCCHE